jgi:hypothetical protein
MKTILWIVRIALVLFMLNGFFVVMADSGGGHGNSPTPEVTTDPCQDHPGTCGGGDNGHGVPTTGSEHANCNAAQGEVDPSCTEATEPPATEPAATEPPATEVVTEPAVTEPPVTEPVATEPPATEPVVTATQDFTPPPASDKDVLLPITGADNYLPSAFAQMFGFGGLLLFTFVKKG